MKTGEWSIEGVAGMQSCDGPAARRTGDARAARRTTGRWPVAPASPISHSPSSILHPAFYILHFALFLLAGCYSDRWTTKYDDILGDTNL